jgi:hypothetical protein
MYDLHIDEVTYTRFAQTIDAGMLPRDFNGQAFFLHPPGYFAMLAFWRAIFWHGGNIFAQYTLLRTMNIFLAGLTVLCMFGLTKLVTRSNKLALLAAAIFTIDPFLIRQNTRSLMETATMLWLLIGLWLLLRNIQKPSATRLAWLGTGFMFGLAFITKDVAANFTILMFALMAIRKVGPPRRAFRYLIPGALAPYSVWLAIVAISGYSGAFIEQKTVGVRRFFGLVQITGFNATNSPSKSGTLLQTIPHYASSYGIMALGAAAACWLLLSKDPHRRRWGCIGTAATLLLGYLYVGGTFEEQYLYYLMVPSIISVIVGFVELWQVVPAAYHRLIKALAIIGVLGVMAFGTISYAINVPKTSTGWQTTIAWVDKNVPPNSTISVFGQGQFLLGGHGFNIGGWPTMSAIQSHHVQYIIVSEKLTYSNYEPINASTFAQVKKVSTIAFRYNSPDSGVFDVVKLNNPYSTPAQDTVKPPTTTVASAPEATTIPATATTPGSTVAAGTLPNTGSSIADSFKIFGSTAAFGTGLAYAFFYFKNRRLYREQENMIQAGYIPGSTMPNHVFSPEYAGSLAVKGVGLW